MARSIISPAEIKILDEPTAAHDPVAEAGVYEDFRELSRGSTTICKPSFGLDEAC